ncbi:methyltransferase type 11 [Nocardia donostiensis]|uniref:Methyltransferase type 11 n=2 Tax=Nocardia donostiensis TaxID=1538463 RepID=A0A1W0B1V7_9NOCA|nr:methyltransferase type 11 [Nocardia donostiensis]ONM50674.1 methyltransferase type 11 [Nocardia donostiensis]OQS16480.1 methyltransferase type 11 [Nocardia donostiensis]OQS17098.1 methyltransferase type 11 [Nocardia donostiensis]
MRSYDRSLRCANRHSFDIARQGYISLLTGASTKMTGDTAAMLDARAAFQAGSHFAPIAAAVTRALGVGETHPPAGGPGLPIVDIVLEMGAGTGYYLAQVLDVLPQALGIALDVSKAAGRRCARAHPRAASVVADAWQGLPVRDHALYAALSVFAPRNPAAVARSLRPDGRYVVVTPTAEHLRELVGPLGMVTVEPDKEQRLGSAMSGHFDLIDRTTVAYPMQLTRADITRLVAMGPSAHHVDAAAASVGALPERYEATASVIVSSYRPTVAAT